MKPQAKLFSAALLALAWAATPAGAASVRQDNLVSDGAIDADTIDPDLVNPWGISFSPTAFFWVSDNGTGKTTLYDGSGAKQGLVVSIPGVGGAGSSPTGQVFNGTGGFMVSKGASSGSAFFIFVTENGTISGWNPSVDPANAITAVDRSARNAVYKGAALAVENGAGFLLAANFRSGFVEVYDSAFRRVRAFRDKGGPGIDAVPFSFAPFNVAVLGGRIFVSYAAVAAGKMDDAPGAGRGFVDEVRLDGSLVRRIASHGALNSPWGMALAPEKWGRFAGKLLVGNFGDGRVNVYDQNAGRQIGVLHTANGKRLRIPGLWALTPGNDGGAGSSEKVYFTAGPNDEQNGLFGSLAFQP